jgi:hypothetical protein
VIVQWKKKSTCRDRLADEAFDRHGRQSNRKSKSSKKRRMSLSRESSSADVIRSTSGKHTSDKNGKNIHARKKSRSCAVHKDGRGHCKVTVARDR